MTAIETNSDHGSPVNPHDVFAGELVASLQEIKKTYYMGALSVEVLHGITLDFYAGDFSSFSRLLE